MTELEDVYNSADRNYRESLRFLGHSVSLVQDLVEIYQRAADIAAGSPLAARAQYLMSVQFSMASRYYFMTAIHACFRGHISDTFAATRMAIEQAAFAARVKRNPAFAPIWLMASQDEQAYEKYREKFRKLFPFEHQQLKELGTRYDFCAKQTHPSVHSFATRSKVEETEHHYTLKFDYFQVDRDGAELVRTFIWILSTHLLIVQVFREVLAEALVDDATAYEFK